MSKTANQFDKFIKDTTDLSAGYSDACSKSGTIFMKGMEDIMGTIVSIAQDSAEKQASFLKEAMSTKTINEFAELQSKIAQASFDDMMAGVTKISEISAKVLTESSEPVNAQLAKTMKFASEKAAA